MFKYFFIFGCFALAASKDDDKFCHCGHFEEHWVDSKGYIISVFRIVVPDDRTKRNETVLMVPGMFSNAYVYTTGEAESLACQFFANGIDIWIQNVRGTSFSQNHTSLSTKSKQFWDYSYDEMGTDDLASTIDYILKVAEIKQLHFLGHSAGCVVIIPLLTTHIEYQRKMKSVQLLAPSIYTRPPTDEKELRCSIIIRLHALGIFDILGMYSYKTDLDLEESSPYINYTKLIEYQKKFIEATSVKQAAHQLQLAVQEEFAFRKFDYMFTWENQEKYGSDIPPIYDLSLVRNKIDIWYSESDQSVTLDGIAALLSQFPNAECHLLRNFTHLDFLYPSVLNENFFSQLIKKILM